MEALLNLKRLAGNVRGERFLNFLDYGLWGDREWPCNCAAALWPNEDFDDAYLRKAWWCSLKFFWNYRTSYERTNKGFSKKPERPQKNTLQQMVVISIKQSNGEGFLYETTTDTLNDDLIESLVNIHNARLQAQFIADAVRGLAAYGPMKNPEDNSSGLDVSFQIFELSCGKSQSNK